MRCADWAHRARGHLGDYLTDPDEVQVAVVDLMTDLCHLLEREGHDVEHAIESVRMHYLAERLGGEDADG